VVRGRGGVFRAGSVISGTSGGGSTSVGSASRGGAVGTSSGGPSGIVFALVRTHPDANRPTQTTTIGQWPVANGQNNRRFVALVFIKNLRTVDLLR
jgi:hypothetical protein